MEEEKEGDSSPPPPFFGACGGGGVVHVGDPGGVRIMEHAMARLSSTAVHRMWLLGWDVASKWTGTGAMHVGHLGTSSLLIQRWRGRRLHEWPQGRHTASVRGMSSSGHLGMGTGPEPKPGRSRGGWFIRGATRGC